MQGGDRSNNLDNIQQSEETTNQGHSNEIQLCEREQTENSVDIDELYHGINIEELVCRTKKKFGQGSYKRKQIFKVPEYLCMTDREDYLPLYLSIGPYHHSKFLKEKVQDGEGNHHDKLVKEKDYALHAVCQKYDFSLADFFRKLIPLEEEIRNCYEEILTMSRESFLEILLTDAIFIVWFLVLLHQKNEKYEGPTLNLKYIRDLVLVENQIPYIVLKAVYSTAYKGNPPPDKPLAAELGNLINMLLLGTTVLNYEHHTDPVHLLHLVHTSLKPTECTYLPGDYSPWRRATEYRTAGVSFKKMPSAEAYIPTHELLAVKFERGVLWIPKLTIGDSTKDLFRNLIAFEQEACTESYVTEYAVFMSQLLSMPDDVDLLSRKGIIEHYLSCDADVSKFFARIVINVQLSPNSYLEPLRPAIQKYYKGRWNRWFAWLKHKHDNPWLILSLVVGAILLICSIIQAIFSVLDKC